MSKKFYKHLRIKDSNGSLDVSWVIDRELERNIETLLQSNPNADEEFLARLFLKNFRSEPLVLALLTFWGKRCLEIQTRQPVEAEQLNLWFIKLAYPLLYWRALARRHLSYFLEQIGYQAANGVYIQLSSFQQNPQLQFDKCDVWQTAFEIASAPGEFFKNFDFNRPLENYARRTMEGKIRDKLVSLGMKKMSSDSALLRYSTQRFLREALQYQGYRQPQLDRYLSAWDCFKKNYASQRPTGSRSLPAPTEEQFKEIAKNLYNQQVQPSQQLDWETIKAWLSECIKALRNYQNRLRDPLSSDAPRGGNEDSPPLSESEDFKDTNSDSHWVRLEIQEPAKQLKAALSGFLPQQRQDANKYLLLLLTCGLDLECRSIAPIFEVCHTTVNRRYNSEMQRLLKKVAEWAQQQLGVTPDSEALEIAHAALKQYLNQHYQDLVFQSVFQSAWQQLDQQHRKLLHLHYFLETDESKIANDLQLPESEVSSGLVTGRRDLATAIASWIQQDFNLNLPPKLVDKIAIKVPVLTKNYPDETLY